MILNSPYVTGSLTVTGNITASGGITISGSISSASYSANADRLDNLDSTSFVFTSSYNTDSASVSTRVTKIEGNYATTGSNVFIGGQTVCGNITSTGTIIAQTLNVQQVTSSIVYSSGSNTFGCQLTDVQQMTGSVRITGSLNTIGIACFSNVVCTPQLRVSSTGDLSYIYNSGASTTDANFYIYSATKDILMVRNSGCIGIGTANPTKALEIVSNTSQDGIKISGTSNPRLTIVDTTNSVQFDALTTDTEVVLRSDTNHPLHLSTNGTLRLNITNTGIACFSCQVCAPNVSIVNCLGVGTAAGAGYILDVYQPASSTTAYARIKNNRTRNAALQLETNCGNYLVGVGIGTDTNRLMIYDNNAGATRLTLDQCGNVGLGTTPAAWVSTARAFQINAYNSIASQHNGSFNIISEAYESAANTFAYGSTGGYPTRINMNPNDGVISIFNAPTGTAGNTITWCERMRITSAGCVGIGTESPNGLLHIQQCRGGEVGFRITNSQGAAGNTSATVAINMTLQNGAGGNSGVIQLIAGKESDHQSAANVDDYFAITTTANDATLERMRITSGGNIQISSDSAYGSGGGQLQINKDASSTPPTLTLFGWNNLSVDQAAGVVNFSLQTTGTAGQVASSIRGLNADLGESSGHLAFYTTSNTSTPAGSAGTERMRITSGGNVIVGDTADYSVRMHVAGVGATTSTGNGSSNIVMLLRDTTAGAINVGAGIGFAGNDGVNTGVTFATINGRKENSTSGNYASYLAFQTRVDGGALTERMRIRSGGEVSFMPTTWNYTNPSTTYRNSDFGAGGLLFRDSTDAYITSNTYYNTGGDWVAKYTTSNGIGLLKIEGGNLSWSTHDASVTAASTYALTGRFTITRAGIACFSTTVCAPCFATISDYRMKHNLRPIEGLSIIMNTKPYKFDYNYDCSTSFGMIAHELQDVVPEAVFGHKDGDVMQGVDYMKLLPIAIKAIQEQQCKINILESCLGIN